MKMNGLVLIGGESRRMGRDKALMGYHGKAQYIYSYELLNKFCDQVFLSLKESRKDQYDCEHFPCIFDDEEYKDMGPLGGILSAFKKFADTAWLVLACDLPNVDACVIRELINNRGREVATVFRSSHNGLPEPLCAIYEKQMFPILDQQAKSGLFCPRKIISNAGISLIEPVNPKSLDNINNMREFNAYQMGDLNAE